MKLLSINESDFGSTGKIMRNLSSLSNADYRIACADCSANRELNHTNTIYIGNRITRHMNLLFGKSTGISGVLQCFSTFFFLRKVKRFKPDIIHLHNLHNCYVNLPMLFKYIKKNNISVVWTLHDCWSFTGRCPHFVMEKCNKWITGCHDCPYPKNSYPASRVDGTKKMWQMKKKWFTGVDKMTIVTPSEWLAALVKQSFLKDNQLKVINNGIDLSIFKPTSSDFREKHNITEKYIVLGVAFGWGKRKGLDVFINLASRLSDDYRIVLVGTDDSVDKQLPDSIVSIHRTQSQSELVEIYTTSDVFANPTREDTFPTVNIEALACGTPVVAFQTGGSPEIPDETCGSVVECDDNDALLNEIVRICENHPYSKQNCLNRAKKYDMNDKFDEYFALYKDLYEGETH